LFQKEKCHNLKKKFHLQNRILIKRQLESYKRKYNAKNWSDFANKKIFRERSTSTINSPKAKITDIVIFKSKIGKLLDFSKQRSSLAPKASIGPSSIPMQHSEEQERRKDEKSEWISTSQFDLLESIGSLTKYRDSYFPQNLNEIEYFIKIYQPCIYDNLYSYNLKSSLIEQKISYEIIQYGMSIYRNSMTLNARK